MSDRVIDALRRAHLALSVSHNLTVTDRPELPRETWPVWVTDHRAEISALDEAIDLLSSGTDLGCAGRSTSPSTTTAGSQ